MRDFGHLFIYDEKTLTDSMKQAGFTDITRCEINHSESEAFRDLEHETRMPDGFLQLETLTLEAVKKSG